MIKKTYKTREPSFIKPRDENILLNLDGACHTYLSTQALEAWQYYHSEFAVCSGRGGSKLKSDLEDLIEEVREKILNVLELGNEFEVIFTKNATEALNMAYAIVGNHVEKTCKVGWEIGVHPLAHKSLIAPAQRLSKEYDVNWRPITVKTDNGTKDFQFPKTWLDSEKKLIYDFVYGLPYIDNVFGINHWAAYIYETLPNNKFQNVRLQKRHFIVDATQALPYIFCKQGRNENSMYLNNKTCFAKAPLRTASAIAFSAHKFHCPHLGILLIRKEYLENENFFKLNNIINGGGNLSFENGQFISVPGSTGLEAGLKDNASILAFGAFLDHITDGNDDFYRINDLNNLNKDIKKIIREVSNGYLFPADLPPIFSNIYAYSVNNVLPLITHKMFDPSMVNMFLAEKKIETRSGKFCADYFFKEFQQEEMLRFSFDYSFLIEKKENLKKLENNIAQIVYEMGDLHFKT